MIYQEAGADIRGARRQYRYSLWRIWDRSLPAVLFIGLNPSTADARRDDPTLVRCMGFARDWGFGGVYTVNLFAFRATDPEVMKRARHPVGRDNDNVILATAARAQCLVAAWGNDGAWRGRGEAVRSMLPGLHYLKLNATGQPAHPLYLPRGLHPMAWA
ncbi:MAG: DUF1643 domain-containing protein [Halieaceae bacterium]|jgi:hypothetical protein|nr:DUF1643 domain-containing protein [Halieaceae bacterium]